MKKSIMIVSVLLVAAALVTGSIAFFTDSVESNQNVIAAGSLDIVQHEYERQKENGAFVQDAATGVYALNVYTQNQAVYPCTIQEADLALAENRSESKIAFVNAENVQEYAGNVSLYQGSVPGFIDKIVTAENAGTLICHVRTFVAVPAFDLASGESIRWIHLDLNRDADWVWADPIRGEIEGKAYDIYKGTYQKQLQPGEFTKPSLLGFFMDSSVSNNGQTLVYKSADKNYPLLSTGESWNILVKSEASQAIVFDGAEEALITTFEGDGNANYHPWIK